MSTINEETVRRLAELSRLGLTSEEAAELESDLGRIMGFVDAVRSVDTTGVEPLFNVLDQATPLRQDQPVEPNSVDAALQNAPAAETDLIVVPKVIE